MRCSRWAELKVDPDDGDECSSTAEDDGCEDDDDEERSLEYSSCLDVEDAA